MKYKQKLIYEGAQRTTKTEKGKKEVSTDYAD